MPLVGVEQPVKNQTLFIKAVTLLSITVGEKARRRKYDYVVGKGIKRN